MEKWKMKYMNVVREVTTQAEVNKYKALGFVVVEHITDPPPEADVLDDEADLAKDPDPNDGEGSGEGADPAEAKKDKGKTGKK